jgi:hypothetical protein
MKRYGNEMKRVLIAVIVIAAIIATGILIASYNIKTPDEQEPPSTNHTPDLPIAPFTIIVQSGTDGTRAIADLEFGFRKHKIQSTSGEISYHYTIGYKRDFLEVRNGFNKSGVAGLGYTEIRVYSFAYLGETKLFDNRDEESPDGFSTNQPDWTTDSAEGSHIGPIRQENLTHLTNAGVILELIDFSIYFNDGSNFVCGPSILTVGVNFTRSENEWIIDYIYDASDNESVIFTPASVSIQLSNPVPEKAEDNETPGQTVTSTEMSVVLFSVPSIIAIMMILVIIIVTRRHQ